MVQTDEPPALHIFTWVRQSLRVSVQLTPSPPEVKAVSTPLSSGAVSRGTRFAQSRHRTCWLLWAMFLAPYTKDTYRPFGASIRLRRQLPGVVMLSFVSESWLMLVHRSTWA